MNCIIENVLVFFKKFINEFSFIAWIPTPEMCIFSVGERIIFGIPFL